MHPKEVMEKYGFPLISKQQSQSINEVRHTKTQSVINRRLGIGVKKNTNTISSKWRYLLNEPYNTSDKCCTKLKKEPFHLYEQENKVYPILGVMASESSMREKMYINQGQCNSFGENGGKIKSLPLSIWMEDDIWAYIKDRKLEIAEIYNKGAKRTGCMFCGYGCQFAEDNRLQLVYDLHPKFYELFMDYTNNGVTYREALRKVLKVNKLCLPDENPQQTLF